MDSISPAPWPQVDAGETLLTPLATGAHRAWRRWVASAAFASGGLLSATVAGALMVVDTITRASKVTAFDAYTFSPFELDLPAEDVAIPSDHGKPLSGWWLPRQGATQVVVVCYGYRNRKSDMLGIGAALWRHGYNVLLFDYHGHGAHAGTRVTLGYHELEDALAAVHYALSRVPSARLGILGYSMGAAVAIMSAAREERIAAVVADSPFAAQRNPVSRRLRRTLRLNRAGRPILFFADLMLARLLGYRFRDVEPRREIAALGDRPILLIHGTADSVIDVGDSELLYATAPGPKELWLLEGVDHCGAYFVDRPAYVSRVLRFLDAALGCP
jgi:dipeptidyl aminopeptidase/acylaminoacyl peptidase